MSTSTPNTNAMNNPATSVGPIVDDIDVRTLYTESSYEATTTDGWTLVITRYQPIPQPWHQPLLNEPLVCVHGFSQNRYAWITGDFARNMLYFGTDLHFVELRGHGRSSRALQREKSAESGKPLPANYDWEWDLDDYFLRDLPAVIEAVKSQTGHEKVFYCGHSMGGMLGYGLASSRDDIAGLITVGSPLDLGNESRMIRIAARAGALLPVIQSIIDGYNRTRKLEYKSIRAIGKALRGLPVVDIPGKVLGSVETPQDIEPKVVRMDLFLQMIYWFVHVTDQEGFYIPKFMRIFNPAKHVSSDLEWILTEGGEKEPLLVLQQFIRWINRKEMKCYSTDYDFKANIGKVTMPVSIIFGDEDFLAGVKSTKSVYDGVASDYVVWRPVRGNSHLEITMGADIRQICYDIKNMMEYALAHKNRKPRLPRKKVA